MRLSLISETDFALYKVTDDVEEAVSEIVNFYSNFHSYRYIGDKLVIRLQDKIEPKAFSKLSKQFADIIKSGEMKQSGALREERDESALADLPRIVLRHGRSDFGRLRQFIDAVNKAAIEES